MVRRGVISLVSLALLGWHEQPLKGKPQLAIEVNLERRTDGQWQSVDSQTVFNRKDQIRFRFRTTVSGYLYVLDRTTSGETVWLFPVREQGQMSRVEAGPEYLVPGTKGSYEIEGAPGFDVTYWMLSSVPMDPAVAAPALGSQPDTLLPRCRQEQLQARGICTDERAGPHILKQAGSSPLPVPSSGRLIARDLKFQTESGSTRISAPNASDGVILYEFHVAHR